MSYMGRKPKDPGKQDRHIRKSFNLRLHQMLRQQLEILADRNASDLSHEISTAIRERLEKAGLWPPREQAD